MSGLSLKKVLLATDGSEDAALAGRAAADLSRLAGAELHVVHAWHDIPSPHAHKFIRTELKRQGQEVLDEQVGRIEGEVARAHLREGRSVDVVLELAGEIEADLIIVGSRGAGALKRLALGSVSEGIAHRTACPVLVLRNGDSWPPRRIIAGDDSSEAARSAVELAAGFAGLLDAELVLVQAHPGSPIPVRLGRNLIESKEEEFLREAEKGLEERLAELPADGVRTRIQPFVGDAAASIIRAAEEGEEPSLIAVGSRGLGAVNRARLGSVSTKVLRAARCPVLIAPHPGE